MSSTAAVAKVCAAISTLQDVLKSAGLNHAILEIRLATGADGRKFSELLADSAMVRMHPKPVRDMIARAPIIYGIRVTWPETVEAVQA
ncbi:hypothetical protein GIW81_00735 [Hyphomicrobium sp. xq]|uniref:Uncharacterized protein n=1 Tax=Hyphomicrobium album TaxID=2665159 RepID=A0A6I3KET7_9HYPH|nr:hypothetical protein [Hyphomicrobium album]MTD92853.1 hypothetical protein [Hyphomicrobium album]